MANPTDNVYSIARQTGEGIALVTPAFINLYNNPKNALNLTSKTLTSSTMKNNRALVSARKTSFANQITLETELCRHAGYRYLMESACGNTFSSGVLKGNNVDTFHTVEKVALEAGTVLRQRAIDAVVSKMQLTVDAENYGVVSYTLTGTGRTDGASLISGATYADATGVGPTYTGADVGTIAIGGLVANYMSLDFSIDQARDSKFKMGSNTSGGTAAKGARMIKLTLKLYRHDFTPETLLIPDTPISASFTLGVAGSGYTFTLPAAVSTTVPQSDTSGSSEMVTVELTATNDPVTGTDIIVTEI